LKLVPEAIYATPLTCLSILNRLNSLILTGLFSSENYYGVKAATCVFFSNFWKKLFINGLCEV